MMDTECGFMETTAVDAVDRFKAQGRWPDMVRAGDHVRVIKAPTHISRVERYYMTGSVGTVKRVDGVNALVRMDAACNAFGSQTYWIAAGGLERVR